MKIIKFIMKYRDYFPTFNDFLIFLGIIMAGRGLGLIYEPAMWFLCGLFLIYLGWPKKVVK